jgi:hypothetical protein
VEAVGQMYAKNLAFEAKHPRDRDGKFAGKGDEAGDRNVSLLADADKDVVDQKTREKKEKEQETEVPVLSTITVDSIRLTNRQLFNLVLKFGVYPENYGLPDEKAFKALGIKKSTADDYGRIIGQILMELTTTKNTIIYGTSEQFNYDIRLRAWTEIFARELQGNVRFAGGGDVARFSKSKNWKESNEVPFFRFKYELDPSSKDPETLVRDNAKGLVLKKGARPSEAIMEFFSEDAKKNGASLDCASFIVVVNRRALLATLGENKYNDLFKNLPIAGLRTNNGLSQPDFAFVNPLIGSSNSFSYPKDVKAGDYRHENVVLISRGLLIGHPIKGQLTPANMKKAIENEANIKGSELDTKPGYTIIDPNKLPTK